MTAPEEEAPSPPPWRNPWVLGGLLGVLFVTLMRPCTRNVPPPPPAIGPLPPGIASPGEPLSTEVPTVLGRIQLPCEASCRATLAAIAQLVEGHVAWETPVETALLIHGDEDEMNGFEPGPEHPESVKRLLASPEADRELGPICAQSDESLPLVLVDAAHDVRGCYAASEEGTREAFHRSVRVWQSQSDESP